jgi:hypothetical protein
MPLLTHSSAGGPVGSISEVSSLVASGGKLLQVVEVWLRSEMERRHEAKRLYEKEHGPVSLEATVVPNRTPLGMSSKHLAFFR